MKVIDCTLSFPRAQGKRRTGSSNLTSVVSNSGTRSNKTYVIIRNCRNVILPDLILLGSYVNVDISVVVIDCNVTLDSESNLEIDMTNNNIICLSFFDCKPRGDIEKISTQYTAFQETTKAPNVKFSSIPQHSCNLIRKPPSSCSLL